MVRRSINLEKNICRKTTFGNPAMFRFDAQNFSGKLQPETGYFLEKWALSGRSSYFYINS